MRIGTTSVSEATMRPDPRCAWRCPSWRAGSQSTRSPPGARRATRR
jgi:hypothetical protein